MRFSIRPVMLLLPIILISTASASEIYKWTDDDGNVHYTDKPVGTSVERVAISSRPTNNRNVRTQVQARLADEASSAGASQPDAPTPTEKRAKAKKQAERCAESKDRLTRYVQSRRLYRKGDAGEREYLNDSEIDEARAEAEEQVAKNCSS